MEIQDREQLLNRRFTSNAETTIDLDYSLQHHNSMNNAHRGIDDMLMTGKNFSVLTVFLLTLVTIVKNHICDPLELLFTTHSVTI